MRSEDKIKKLEEFGIIDPDVSGVIKSDYEKIKEELKEETEQRTSSLISAAKCANIKLFI
jgi:flagellar capping protein FliD